VALTGRTINGSLTVQLKLIFLPPLPAGALFIFSVISLLLPALLWLTTYSCRFPGKSNSNGIKFSHACVRLREKFRLVAMAV